MTSTNDYTICPTCGKGVQDFKDAKLFRRHLKNHENEKSKVICEFCPKDFQTDRLVQEFSLPENLIPFITCLENLQLLNQGVSGVVLDNNYKELIENF